MPSFRYEAVAATGELVSGEMEAATRDEIILRLQRLGHVPIRAESGARTARWALPRLTFARRRGGSMRELARLTLRLSVLLEAGLSLDRALEIARGTSPDAAEAKALDAILQRVRGGSALADAMAADAALFPKFYVGMVRAGEAGATLDATLRDLGSLIEPAAASREQVKSALLYPALVLATCLGAVAMLFLFVVPRFRPIFDQANAPLPPVAAAVLAIADFSRDWWWAVLVVLALAVMAARRLLRRAEGRAWLDRKLLALPLLGDVATKLEVGRFAYTLGVLLKNGVAPVEALGIARAAVGNSAIAAALASVSQSLKEGKGLAAPIAAARIFPALAVQLIEVGEETAHLDAMLVKIGDIYAEETRRSVERMLALLVPALTVLMGLVVVVTVGSIFTAILSLYDLAL